MALYAMTPGTGPAPAGAHGELVCFALVVAQAVYLVTLYPRHLVIAPSAGYGVPPDFVNIWAAGRSRCRGTRLRPMTGRPTN